MVQERAMGKVVTSQGLTEFIQNGKFETVKDAKPNGEAAALEVVKPPPTVELGEKKEAKVEDAPADEDPETQAEIEKSERFRKTINKKHRAMKEAQEAATDAEEFARSQYNRARLAEERAQALERQLNDSKPAVKAEPEIKKPTHDELGADGKPKWYMADAQGNQQFKAFEYAEALASFAATKAVADDRAKQVEEANKAATAAAEAAAKARVAESRTKHADYDETMEGADVKTHQAVLQYMTGSENIGEIAYYLAKNPDYVERINKLNPLKAIAEIGKLELTFEKPKAEPSKETAAAPKVGVPPPIQPLSSAGTGIIQTDPAKMDFKELREYERRRKSERTRH
jgi:hypothetical protein